MPSNDDLGEIGQSTLAAWAGQVGATANPSTKDKRGWDFFLQFASSDGSRSAGPLDRALPEISCMIQVKATLGSSPSSSIKLSNWRRMISDPQPWFVLFIQLSEDLEPSSAYLLHVDETWSAKVLKRLRELGKTPLDLLHRHTLDATCNESDRLPRLHGRALIERIRSIVSPNQHAYFERKMAHFSTAGYDGSPREIRVSLHASDRNELWTSMADLGVGLRKTLPGYTSAEVFDRRFGVRGTLAELEPTDGEIEFRAPPVGEARLELTDPEGARSVGHDCVVYRAGCVFPFLPEEHDRVRFASEYLSLSIPVIPPKDEAAFRPAFGFQLPIEVEVSLEMLDLVIRTGELLQNPSEEPLVLGLSGVRNGIPWDIKLPFAPAGVIEELVQLLEELKVALRVITAFGISSETKIMPAQILDQSSALKFLDAALGPAPGALQGPTRQRLAVGDIYGAPAEVSLSLPAQILIGGVAIYGAVTEIHDEPWGQMVIVANPTCVVDRLVLTDAEFAEFDENALLERTVSRLRAAGCTAIHPRAEKAARADADLGS